MRRWLIKKLGGYPDIDAAIGAIKAKDGREKYDILNLAVRKLFNTLCPDDILSENSSGQWMYEGKILTPAQVKILQQEVNEIINKFTWKVLVADVKYKANKMMYRTAITESQLASGKLWLYTIDTINTRLKSITEGTGHFNKAEK